MSDTLEVPVRELVGRVIRSSRRVEFLDCDPYRHLSGAAWLRFATDHRFTGTYDELGLDSFDLPERTGIAWPIRHADLDFQAEAALGDTIDIESWIDRVLPSRVVVKLRMSRRRDGAVCCLVTLTILAFDLRRRCAIQIPVTLPVHRRVDLDALPWADGHAPAP